MNQKPLALLTALLLTTVPLFGFADSGDSAASSAAKESLRQTGKAFASVARSVEPSVVFIEIQGTRQSAPTFGPDDFLRHFFGDQFPTPQQQQPQTQRIFGEGSGFVFRTTSGKSYIMTNNHVVKDANKIRVRFQDGKEYDAKVTGTDPQSDVAIIEIPAVDAPPLPLAKSSDIDVGEWVVAIGSPFGLRSTLTVGVVSATGRTSLGINDYEDFIQTDAAINPGNSGGPLVNLDGQVIGMNTAIFSRTGGYMGIGFAIPIDLAKNIGNQLIDTGKVTRGFLGVIIQPLTQDLAQSFNIERNQGILVSQVSDDSPASKAGIKVGDVIVGYRGQPVTDVGDFRNKVALTQPDTKVEMTVLRKGQRKTLNVKIGSLAKAGPLAQNGGAAQDIGMAVGQITPDVAQQLNIPSGQGVMVTEVAPDSPAASVGLSPGDVILEVNQRPVTSVQQFYADIQSSANKRAVMLVRSQNVQRYVVLSW